MRVFISWSGDRSLYVAEALREWLPDVVQSVRPWVSKKDIPAGAEWLPELGNSLKDPAFGVVVVTADNLDSRWLNYEAGALVNALTLPRVCPLLVGLAATDVSGPLAQRQSVPATREGLALLVKSVNDAWTAPLGQSTLERQFTRLWPDLEQKLSTLPPVAHRAPKRSESDLLMEILGSVRALREDARTATVRGSIGARLREPVHFQLPTPAEGDTFWSYLAALGIPPEQIPPSELLHLQRAFENARRHRAFAADIERPPAAENPSGDRASSKRRPDAEG